MTDNPIQAKSNHYTLVVLNGNNQDDALVEALFALKGLFLDRINLQEALLVTCQGQVLHDMLTTMLSEMRKGGASESAELEPDPGSDPQGGADLQPIQAEIEPAPQSENTLVEQAAQRTCEYCGKPFTPSKKNSTVCSRTCQNARYRQTHRKPRAPQDTITVTNQAQESEQESDQVRKWLLPDGKEVDDASHLLQKGKLQAGDILLHKERGKYLVVSKPNGKLTLQRQAQAQV